MVYRREGENSKCKLVMVVTGPLHDRAVHIPRSSIPSLPLSPHLSISHVTSNGLTGRSAILFPSQHTLQILCPQGGEVVFEWASGKHQAIVSCLTIHPLSSHSSLFSVCLSVSCSPLSILLGLCHVMYNNTHNCLSLPLPLSPSLYQSLSVLWTCSKVVSLAEILDLEWDAKHQPLVSFFLSWFLSFALSPYLTLPLYLVLSLFFSLSLYLYLYH